MIHLYHGEGKGKTTAAFGLALRALAAGWHVCVVQFLKDGTSGEARLLASMRNATLLACGEHAKFTWTMDEHDRARARDVHDALVAQAATLCEQGRCQLLVLDEVCAALGAGLVDEHAVRELAQRAAGGQRLELVATGRFPPAWLVECGDYITHMRCERHPAAQGLEAREGVEL